MKTDEFIMYLGKMHTMFDAVAAAASSLMEMNAMNVSPTEEESLRCQSAFIEIGDRIRQMKNDAQEKIGEYNSKKEKSAEASKKAIEEHTKMQENLVALEKENADAKVVLVQKSVEKDRYERECRESEAKLAETSRRRDAEIKKAEEKRENLKKWFWVPGYGLYLAIDTLVNELDNEIESLGAQVERERRRRDDLTGQYNEISREVEERNRKIEAVRKKMQDQILQMERQNAAINDCKKQLLYWEDFYMQISKLETKLKAGANSPDMLYELVELMEAFESAAEE